MFDVDECVFINILQICLLFSGWILFHILKVF
jgi:hypothetical protein